MKTYRLQNEEVAAHTVQERLEGLLALSRETDMLLLCSGGSALDVLEMALPAKAVPTRITCGVIDERWRAADADRNDRAVRGTSLVRTLLDAGAAWIAPDHEAATRTAAAVEYNTALHAWHAAHPDGVVMGIFGIGADAHTAGIMPFGEDEDFFTRTFLAPDKWVADFDATGKNPFANRVTITCSYMQHINHALVYAVGANKADALNTLQTDVHNCAAAPARCLHTISDAHLYRT